jgi:hypothetical protein
MEIRMRGSHVRPTPLNGGLAHIEPPILARGGKVSGQGSRHPPHPTTQIEDPLVAVDLGQIHEVTEEFPPDAIVVALATEDATAWRSFRRFRGLIHAPCSTTDHDRQSKDSAVDVAVSSTRRCPSADLTGEFTFELVLQRSETVEFLVAPPKER